ncbi:MAG TPA: SAM-dependent chlorinase/fluorinase [Phycisphaerae bacterium]|nr:SAM-dependent chlorinase/fluorinase [Phycisphaerae bacterium]
MAVITLTTDFGRRDHYVASMKGVILQIDPAAVIVDISHEITPQQVTEAAFVLRSVWPAFGEGTIHVVVVDPQVGTDRRILAARYDGRIVLVPDNGAISLVHRDCRLQELYLVQNHQLFVQPVSATFHGRDIFAPVAAHLSRGLPLVNVGPPTNRLELLNLPAAQASAADGLVGQVVYIDRFGNLVTNISRGQLAHTGQGHNGPRVWIDQRDLGPIRSSYASVARGEALALIGSADLLEVAVNQGSAAEHLGARVGTTVQVK